MKKKNWTESFWSSFEQSPSRPQSHNIHKQKDIESQTLLQKNKIMKIKAAVAMVGKLDMRVCSGTWDIQLFLILK